VATTRTGLPDTILLTAKVSPKQASSFYQLELPIRSYQPKYPAGTGYGDQMFGDNGAKDISLIRFWNRLDQLGYKIGFAELQQRENDHHGRRTLMVVFDLFGNQGIDEDARLVIRDFLLEMSWSHVHVWANPPKENGVRIDAVILGGRQPKETEQELDLPWRIVSR